MKEKLTLDTRPEATFVLTRKQNPTIYKGLQPVNLASKSLKAQLKRAHKNAFSYENRVTFVIVSKLENQLIAIFYTFHEATKQGIYFACPINIEYIGEDTNAS